MYAELNPVELREGSATFALDLQNFIYWQKHLSSLIRLLSQLLARATSFQQTLVNTHTSM